MDFANSQLLKKMRDEVEDLHVALYKKTQLLKDMESRLQKETGAPQNDILTNSDITRYSRQIIIPNFGVASQLKLKKASFLIVGMGGLGCPAAQYLVSAGCGKVGIVDYDDVELSNCHRQILHVPNSVGTRKVESARRPLMELNPSCDLKMISELLNHENALDVLQPYDVVLDCTDNVATRYLLNDACVMLHKPLVSGSALQMEGQLTVYHYGEVCPCLRCIFPTPPPVEAVNNCSDSGVLGAVTGVIGSLQALEAIKIATGFGEVHAGRLLLFDGESSTFRNIKLKPRAPKCVVCSPKPMITKLIDYEQFCGMRACDKDAALSILPRDKRVTVSEYKEILENNNKHLLIDVRTTAEFEICKLPGAVNIPLKEILEKKYDQQISEQLADEGLPIFIVCRRGNDSQRAVECMESNHPNKSIRDIIGGLHSWHHVIDEHFPIY